MAELQVLIGKSDLNKSIASPNLNAKRKLKILLGDLRHTTGGKSIVIMPVGIGYIAAYTQAQLGAENLDFNLFVEPNPMIEAIKKTSPDIVAVSNYCWNAELSGLMLKIAKETDPNMICIAGGPDFPIKKERRQNYLQDRGHIDFYAYQEGERAFANLVGKIMIMNGRSLADLKAEPHEGMMSVNPRTGELIIGETYPRMKNLDEIPSPYLGGLMEKWFDGHYAPSLETARGCPFTCTFCEAGAGWYSTVSTFSLERMEKELGLIAQRMAQYPNVLLAIHDSNFGMFKRDEEVADIIRALQDQYDWPNAFEVTTGKGSYDRILKIMAVLKNKMTMSTSVQSLNPETLKIIERRNPPLEKLVAIIAEIKRRGISTTSELILPMPLETKESFFDGFRTLLNAKVNQITPFTTMLFKGTEIASDENRQKYAQQSKFRLLPRQYGEYDRRKCFEIEEVCIATNTMSFEEYLECRGFSLIATVLSNDQFDVIARHLNELGIDIYDFNIYVWNLVRSGKTKISDLYFNYLKETREELWDSPQALIDYYTDQDHYEKLGYGETGDNKIRKYRTKMFLEQSEAMAELAYAAIRQMLGEKANQEIIDSLSAVEKWIIATRHIGNNITNASLDEAPLELHLSYDVNSWYNSDINTSPLTIHKKPVRYRIYSDKKHIRQMMEDGKRLFGDNISFTVGKLLVNFSVKSFWCKTELVAESPELLVRVN